MDAAQTGLFNALPVAVAIPADLLARRSCGRFPHGPASRSLLPWLLLALDGSSFRGRRDEPRLDRRAQRVRAAGENHSSGFLGGQGCRDCPDELGWMDGPFGRSLVIVSRVRSLRWEIGLFSMQQKTSDFIYLLFIPPRFIWGHRKKRKFR